MKAETIRLFSLKENWSSRRQAAKAIVPLVQDYGKEKFNRPLSADRAEQTVYGWINKHNKQKNEGVR